MNPYPDQKQLRALLGEVRRVDRQTAPAFSEAWNAAASRVNARPTRARILLAPVTLAAIGTGMLIAHARHQPQPTEVAHMVAGPVIQPDRIDLASITSVSKWKSPTEFLLDL